MPATGDSVDRTLLTIYQTPGSRMTQPFVIIDGYNLMHAVGLARQQYGPGDLEVCRNRLLHQLSARLNSTASGRTTVVFDAFGSTGNTNRLQEREGITIIYAPAGTDADSELERMIAAHSTPKRLLVVSSDHRLHKAAQRRKAKAIDSDVFWDSLDPESSLLRDPGKPTPPQQATDFWLQEFANVEDETGIARPSNDGVFDGDYLADLESEFGD